MDHGREVPIVSDTGKIGVGRAKGQVTSVYRCLGLLVLVMLLKFDFRLFIR